MTSARIQRITERIVPADQLKEQRFPRDLEATQLHLPLAIVEQEHLNFAAVLEHAPVLKIDADSAKRPLRGCVICSQGSALVFIEKLDDPAEKLFTAAHELGHFVAHYVEPRELAFERFGPGIGDVLDGKRLPSDDERVAGVLSRCPIGVYHHALPQGRQHDVQEDDADAIAFEVLAPLNEVLEKLRGQSIEAAESAAVQLQTSFGLPLWAARQRVGQAFKILGGPHHGFLSSIRQAVGRPV
jgi:Zn-dependent peptidase ImmA (M78 family)